MSRSAPFRSILVPVDGSRLAEQAIPVALAIAERAHSNLRLVLVHQIHQPRVLMEPAHIYIRTEAALQQSERDYLTSLVSRVRERMGRAVSCAILKGRAGVTLAEYIKEASPDLVVMTTHGYGGVRRAWLGSVADQLIRSLDVPILLIRADHSKPAATSVDFTKILVPLDGSPLAEAVLEPAAALARLWDAEISLMQIVQPVFLATDPMLPLPSSYDEQLTAKERDAAGEYVQAVAERLRDEGVKASGVAVLGDGVADELLCIVRPGRIGLVAMATHGRGGLRRFVLGSVADKLARAMEVPLLVVRPAGKRSKRSSRGAKVQVRAGTAV
jgi:nucleotide-binding universal stress UspA family protein